MENYSKAPGGMAVYTCPTCGERMERDLLLFTRHTDAHVIDELKKIHPEWVTREGFCPKCLDHYKAAMHGEKAVANIAGREVKKRQTVGALTLAVSILLLIFLARSGASRTYRLFLWFPFFASTVCFFQVKKSHCVVLGMKGKRNMDHGEEPVTDEIDKKRLRLESTGILRASFLLASFLAAAVYYLF